jgi:hypothetical protein
LNKDEYNLKLVDFGLAFCWDENMKKELKQKGLNKKMAGTVFFFLIFSLTTCHPKCSLKIMMNDAIFGPRVLSSICSFPVQLLSQDKAIKR